MKTYMVIDLPNGEATEGHIDYRREPKRLNIEDIALSGKSVLDIAANDGFWSFWAEKRGSQNVLSTDVDTYEKYDWGFDGIPKKYIGRMSKNTNFYKIKKILNSKVNRECAGVYDIKAKTHGTFDLVFMYGLLYHLRHPLLAIDTIRKVCTSTLILRSHIVNYGGEIPLSLFYGEANTDWCGPNKSCVIHWLKDAGFKYIFVQKKVLVNKGRLTFCACIKKDEFYKRFSECESLQIVESTYFDKVRVDRRSTLDV